MTRSFDQFFNRRHFLKAMSVGGLALAMGKSALAFPGSPLVPKGKLYQNAVGQSKVSLVKGDDRREIVSQILKNIEDEVLPAIGDKKVLIKPNLVVRQRWPPRTRTRSAASSISSSPATSTRSSSASPPRAGRHVRRLSELRLHGPGERVRPASSWT